MFVELGIERSGQGCEQGRGDICMPFVRIFFRRGVFSRVRGWLLIVRKGGLWFVWLTAVLLLQRGWEGVPKLDLSSGARIVVTCVPFSTTYRGQNCARLAAIHTCKTLA